MKSRRQGAGHRDKAAVERQLAQGNRAFNRIFRDHLKRRKHGQGDGQVEMAAFFGKVSGREIYRDAFGRQRDAH